MNTFLFLSFISNKDLGKIYDIAIRIMKHFYSCIQHVKFNLLRDEFGMARNAETLDLLDRILSKQLSWIATVDTKGTLLFAIESAMLAVLAAIVPSVEQWTIAAAVSSSIALISLLASIVFVAFAAFPNLNGARGSAVFFGGIAATDENQYVKKLAQGITNDLLEDFARQCHRNAEIANIKFEYIKKSAISTFLALPFWLISIWLFYTFKFV
ncbi:MAG: hypothetical protein DYH15_13965 [Nitrosomonas sp. PRO4]|nr:hypothetical protein [Nitrosomonas sp. PRO4]